jgi:hypothetical protein
MLPLPQTKYPNVQRTVTGAVDVFPDDVVLNCDTSTGAVTISLGEIPYNATTGVGNWSTQYVLYINDISNNAGTNNITLVAGGTQTVNNQATLVLNTNGVSVMVLISGNGKYVVLNAPNNAPTGFIVVNYAQLTALVSGDDIIPNADYLLTDAEFGTAPFLTPTSVFLKGMTIKNTANVLSQAIFLNADYQAVGNYSGVTGFVAQLGVWTPSLAPVLNDVCIWNNRHYKNLTGANGVTNPTTDNVNWGVLPLQLNNGYISVVDSVVYSYSSNRIVYRVDVFGNEVERTIIGGLNSLNVFSWGNNNVRQNKVLGDSFFNICNNLTLTPNESIFNNNLSGSRVIVGKPDFPANVTLIGNNVFSTSVCSVETVNSCDNFTENNVQSSSLSFTGGKLNTFTKNQLTFSSFTIVDNGGVISDNTFDGQTNATITTNNGTIDRNYFFNGAFTITTINEGNISQNFVFSASLIIDTNGVNANFVRNEIKKEAGIQINTNLGNINFNTVDTASGLGLSGTNNAGSVIYYLNLSGSSQVILTDNNGTIGSQTPRGITLINHSFFNIDINNDNVSGFLLENRGWFEATTVNSKLSSVTLLNEGKIVLRDTIAPSAIDNITLDGVDMGGATFDLTQSLLSGSAGFGFSTIKYNLDMNDPTVYNGGTQTLTIPSQIQKIIGLCGLSNAGAKTISKIVNFPLRQPLTFTNDAGVTTFSSITITTPPVATDIVSSNGTFSFNITTTNGDSITLAYRSTFCVVQNAVIVT